MSADGRSLSERISTPADIVGADRRIDQMRRVIRPAVTNVTPTDRRSAVAPRGVDPLRDVTGHDGALHSEGPSTAFSEYGASMAPLTTAIERAASGDGVQAGR